MIGDNNYEQKLKREFNNTNGDEYVYCPVCRTIIAVYDICDTCHWQNTREMNIDGGPNIMTLTEAKEAYAKGLPIT